MKQREQILLEPEQKQRLQAESDRTGAPKAEIVRRALDAYLDESRFKAIVEDTLQKHDKSFRKLASS
jgi:predicted DNA-binding protein